MSCGERSCVDYGYCYRKMNCCDVNCPYYKWDKETKPDSVKTEEKGQEEVN